jgi:hypothetical protein
MKRGVKKRDYENLTASNIQKVIKLLNPESGGSPITKKEACAILNISYNTKRLDSIIEEHKERVAHQKLRRQQNRGKPAQNHEIQEAVTRYLRGDSIQAIAVGLYRSPAFVTSLIEKIGVPQRVVSAEDKRSCDYLPEECVAESFEEGEIAWSAQYHSAVKVVKEYSKEYCDSKPGLGSTDYEKKYSSKCYSIYVLEEVDSSDSFFPGVGSGGFYANSLAYDLGKLTHLEKYNIDLSRM